MMRHVDYYRPRTLREAHDLKTKLEGARYIAGGTDLLGRIKSGLERPSALISLRSIEGIAGITANGATCIGALTPLNDIVENRVLRERHPVIVQAARTMANVQIRNVATVGGNLCNAAPCADTAPPLLVLDARLRIQGPEAQREMPLADFFRAPGETRLREQDILTAILIDPPSEHGKGIFLKRGRVSVDMALASVAAYVEMDPASRTCRRARLAAGSVAPRPLRLEAVEALLEGRQITRQTLARAQDLARDAVTPISDVRASADYRRHITGVLVRRALEALCSGSSA